ncbi:hypothetical protein DL93DRAFT_1089323 [Clavulina sp. PMI_390]|nr:hypothetical protein DL93DRAFT_1089323 [Clavulina sp. PMI_390]
MYADLSATTPDCQWRHQPLPISRTKIPSRDRSSNSIGIEPIQILPKKKRKSVQKSSTGLGGGVVNLDLSLCHSSSRRRNGADFHLAFSLGCQVLYSRRRTGEL